MSELIYSSSCRKGSRGKNVKLIQEWLCLHGYNLVIDGDFGPATKYAVQEFQRKMGLKSDGIVGKKTFDRIVMPMTEVLKPIPSGNKQLGEIVTAYANQHLKQHPREIGGQNKGPWVRLYMKGHEGAAWPWCAGFACYILKQACLSLDVSLTIRTSFSCDSLAASAKEKGIFLGESKITDNEQIMAGSFFLVRRTSTDWVHTGIVINTEKDLFHTIEGNTNDEGSREGYEVCKRIRGYKKKDFILI